MALMYKKNTAKIGLLRMTADYRFAGGSVRWNITEPSAIATHNLGWPNQIVPLVASKPGHWPRTVPVCQAMVNVPRVATRELQI